MNGGAERFLVYNGQTHTESEPNTVYTNLYGSGSQTV